MFISHDSLQSRIGTFLLYVILEHESVGKELEFGPLDYASLPLKTNYGSF